MTKRKTGRIQLSETDLPDAPEHVPQRLDPSDEELSDVFSGFPQNENCIELFRTNQQGGRPMYLEVMQPCIFSFGYVAEKYGGGYYIAKGKYQGGEIEKRSFEIEGDPFPVKRRVAERNPFAAVLPEANNPSAKVEPLQVGSELSGMGEVLASMMGMMQKMMLETRTSEVEMLTKMKMYKELFSSGEKRDTPVHELIGMVKTGIELGQAGGSGEGVGGFPWLMVLDKIKEPLTKLADSVYVAVSQNKGGGVPNVPVQAIPEHTGSPEAVQPGGETMEGVLIMSLRAMLPLLVTGASQRTDPGFYADLLLDQIPSRYYATAKTYLEKPECVDSLIKMNPSIGNFRPWFDKLKAELIDAIVTEQASDATEPIQSATSSDPSTLGATDL